MTDIIIYGKGKTGKSLYKMLEKTENEDNDAALRWAIFTLEQRGREEQDSA